MILLSFLTELQQRKREDASQFMAADLPVYIDDEGQ